MVLLCIIVSVVPFRRKDIYLFTWQLRKRVSTLDRTWG